MENNPQNLNNNLDSIPAENTIVSTAESEAEAARKELSHKRTTMLLVVLSLIVLAFIVWELVDIALGGRP